MYFNVMALDPKVFGPHYWFFLHTIALNYPKYPNAVTKKKYYDFIQNLPLFLPIEKHATDFSKLLDEYPITPYLDSRDSFVRWMHFIHNKINEKLEKPKISLSEFYVRYYDAYKPTDQKYREYYRLKEKFIYAGSVLLIGGVIYYLYDK
jgi:FAD-linked sulfhydryl oxidase